jgi:cell fate (sporulation/competence/biofilm development) regulator YlbF (YheA/YmcA/DUF963 family)
VPKNSLNTNRNSSQLDTQNIQDASSKSSLLGFELWEVMTAFTIALTIASSLMWFSNLQPRNIQSEFTAQDQLKSSLYTLWTDTNNIQEQGSALYLPPASTECFSQFFEKSIDVQQAEDYIQSIEEVRAQNQTLGDQIDEVNNFVKGEPGLLEAQEVLDTYLSLFSSIENTKLTLAQITLQIQQTLSELCQNGWLMQENEVDTLRELRNRLNTVEDASLREFDSALKNIISELETIGTDLPETPALTPEITQELNTQSIPVWSVSYQELYNQADLFQQEDRFLLALQDYETWQREFSESNSFLTARTVYIF